VRNLASGSSWKSGYWAKKPPPRSEELSLEAEGVLRPLEVFDEAETRSALMEMSPEVVERTEAGGALIGIPPSVSR
jgi:hypothetical protein